MGAITHLIAGVPVSDLDASLASDGMRHVNIPDPDGHALASAELADDG
jgi:hypothetical protein